MPAALICSFRVLDLDCVGEGDAEVDEGTVDMELGLGLEDGLDEPEVGAAPPPLALLLALPEEEPDVDTAGKKALNSFVGSVPVDVKVPDAVMTMHSSPWHISSIELPSASSTEAE